MTAAGPAHVVLDQPAGGAPAFLVLLTHGAGGNPDTADVLAVRDAARELGAATALVTQPYRVKGARAPGSAAKQDAAWAELVEVLRGETARDGARLPLVQCGRSNGARVACRTAALTDAVAVLCLAFPLQPPRRSEAAAAASRLAELDAVAVPTLVVQGTRDPFGTPPATTERTVIEVPGDHSLKADLPAVSAAVQSWLTDLLARLDPDRSQHDVNSRANPS